MSKVRVKAYAKINLTLDILGVKDGYHMLESLVATVDMYDIVTVRSRKDDKINIIMRGLGSEGIPPERNNAYIAARKFTAAFGTNGCDIWVDKNIPMGAGLGGSSADAAAVLNALASVYAVDDGEAVKRVADECGSDTGYMLSGGYAVISGRGEQVRQLDYKGRLDILLLLPKSGVSTAECYARCDKLGVKIKPTTARAEAALMSGDTARLGACLSNGLFPAARTLNGEVADCFERLLGFAPCGVNMTGSGSCVYALCENDSFARYIASRMDGSARCVQVKTITPKKFITVEEFDG